MKHWWRALKYFRQDVARIIAAFILMLGSVGFAIIKPWPLALIVDSVLGKHPLPSWLSDLHRLNDASLIAVLAGAIFALHFAQGGLSALQNYLSIQVSLRGFTRVRNELFEWLQRLSWRYHQGKRAGDLIYRASWDTYAFQTLFQQGLITFATALLSLVLMVVVMARLNVALTLVALCLVPLLVLTIKFFAREMGERANGAQRADSRVTSLVQQGISALPLTQSYTQEDAEAKRFNAQTAVAQQRRLSQHGWELLYGFVIAVVFGLGAAFITWIGARKVLSGQLTTGELLVFIAYLAQLYEPLNQLSAVGTTISGASAGIKRVFEILDTPAEVKDPIGRTGSTSPTSAIRPSETAGAINFEHVSFAYEAGRDVLQDLSFSIPAGQSVAIIGPSGAGKSTLLHLLPRFFDPTTGAIKLDGMSLRDYPVKLLRSKVALVLQEPIILPASVAENIGYGKPNSSQKEIEAAAQAANAHVFIQNLPQKYETVIGEGAMRLSIGERQRIALARAFLKDSPVFLLDEPTSALDAESENLISESLTRLMREKTALIVAHRLNTIACADRILVLVDGRLVESGTPEELKRTGGYYARLVNSA